MIDFVAMSLRTKARRTRRSEARLLGSDAIDRAREANHPLRLLDNGRSWLPHRCRGVAILDWPIVRHRLADPPTVSCDDELVAQRLERAFERPAAVPIFYVPQRKETRHVD